MCLPKPRLAEDGGKSRVGSIKCAAEAAKEPLQPCSNVESVLLRALQDVVIGIPFETDLRGHAVKPLRAFLRTCQNPVRDRTRNATVAIIKGVDRDKPQVSDGGLQNWVDTVRLIHPLDKLGHFRVEKLSRWRFVMHTLPTHWTKDNL